MKESAKHEFMKELDEIISCWDIAYEGNLKEFEEWYEKVNAHLNIAEIERCILDFLRY